VLRGYAKCKTRAHMNAILRACDPVQIEVILIFEIKKKKSSNFGWVGHSISLSCTNEGGHDVSNEQFWYYDRALCTFCYFFFGLIYHQAAIKRIINLMI
jgi:hypothetical protein